MTEYIYAHNLKELNELAKQRYEFLAVVDANTFLMVKTVVVTPPEQKPEQEKDHELGTDQDNAE